MTSQFLLPDTHPRHCRGVCCKGPAHHTRRDTVVCGPDLSKRPKCVSILRCFTWHWSYEAMPIKMKTCIQTRNLFILAAMLFLKFCCYILQYELLHSCNDKLMYNIIIVHAVDIFVSFKNKSTCKYGHYCTLVYIYP